MYNRRMFRFALLLGLAGLAHAGVPPVDIDSAAQLYQEAAIREQVRASLPSMPGQIRKLFQGNTSTPLTDSQLDAVNLAATRAFRIDVFEAPALSAFAANLNADTLKKARKKILARKRETLKKHSPPEFRAASMNLSESKSLGAQQ